jgi:hypothetical protein
VTADPTLTKRKAYIRLPHRKDDRFIGQFVIEKLVDVPEKLEFE